MSREERKEDNARRARGRTPTGKKAKERADVNRMRLSRQDVLARLREQAQQQAQRQGQRSAHVLRQLELINAWIRDEGHKRPSDAVRAAVDELAHLNVKAAQVIPCTRGRLGRYDADSEPRRRQIKWAMDSGFDLFLDELREVRIQAAAGAALTSPDTRP
jgi:hypothetical protein